MSFFGRSAPKAPPPSRVALLVERLQNATVVADKRDIVQELKVRRRRREEGVWGNHELCSCLLLPPA